jgi:hypothetical protein
MIPRTSNRLKTAAQVALRKANQIRREALADERSAEWQRRLDPAAYRCERRGSGSSAVWTATGPAGQSFRFWRDDAGAVWCESQSSGKVYGVAPCDCPDSAREGGCKHDAAWRSVRMAATMTRA